MPKHGWKWRTERLLAMNDDEMSRYLSDHRDTMSAKLGRWIYESLERRSESFAITGLQRIDWEEQATWGHAYLWRELERRKSEAMGDWIIVAMSSYRFPPDAAQRFIRIFNDPSTHILTKGSAVYGLNNALDSDDQGRLPPEHDALARPTCERALHDESPYVRWLALGLAARLGGLDHEIQRLAEDKSVVGGGYTFTVAERAIEAIEDSHHNEAQGLFAHDSE